MTTSRFLAPSPLRQSALAVACSILLLSGCANFQGIAPAAPLKSLNSADLQGKAEWPQQQWIAEFGGAQLQSLIQLAYQDNPGINSAASRIAAARAMQDVAHANTLPSVSGSLEATYEKFTKNGLIPPPLAGNYETDNEYTIGASYELDFWGKHQAEMRAAMSAEQIAIAEQESAKLVLANAISRAWVQLNRAYQQLALSQQQLAIRAQIDRLSAERLRAGLDSRSEVQQNIVTDTSLRNDMTNWQESIALIRHQLAALAGQTPDYAASIPVPALHLKPMEELPANLPLELLRRKPEIVAARWRVEASNSEIDIAKTQFYPNINLTAFVGLSSLGVDKALRSDSGMWGVGPAIHFPIFEGGRLRANLKNKVADNEAAIWNYNQSILNAARDVADQLQSLKTSRTLISQQQQAEQAARKVLELAKARYQAGTSSQLPVLAAENSLLMQQKLNTDLLSKQADAEVNLIKALGGGYQSNAVAPLSSSDKTQ